MKSNNKQFRLLEFSTVLVANDHNPTIINPDFLRINHIVEGEWKVMDAPVSTPAFSRVAYENGLSITVDPNRLNIVDASGDMSVPDSSAIRFAQNYVKVLPHIRYKAVGFNIRVFYEKENPDKAIKAKFLQDGPWLKPSDGLHGVGFKFARAMENGKTVITVESAVVNIISPSDGSTTQKEGIMVFGNFHRDCTAEYPTAEQLKSYLELLAADWESFHSMLNELELDHE